MKPRTLELLNAAVKAVQDSNDMYGPSPTLEAAEKLIKRAIEVEENERRENE